MAKSKIAPEFTPWARVLAMPQVYNHYLELKLLTKDGIENPHIERRDKKHYKFAKKLKWGELIASPESIR